MADIIMNNPQFRILLLAFTIQFWNTQCSFGMYLIITSDKTLVKLRFSESGKKSYEFEFYELLLH